MVDLNARPDVARGRREAVVIREDHRDDDIVHVDHRPQRVKRPLGQGAFRTEAGCRRRFAGQTADEIHDEFRQFLKMNRVVDGQRR